MKREEDWLREACEQLAQEEADDLERSLTRSDIRQAEEVYRHHRKKALALIRRNTAGNRDSLVRYLAAAAALIAIVGAILFSLNRREPENIYLTGGPSVSVAPYYSPVPVPTETVTAAPTPEQVAESTATISPNPDEIIPEITTYLDIIEDIQQSTATPTIIPTEMPTPEPTPEPTETPAPTAVPVPDAWQGGYFPYALPALGQPVSFVDGDGWHSVTYAGDGGEWRFIVYDSADVVSLPENASASYVQWDGAVALRMEDESGVTLAWVQDGHSFSLHSTYGDGLEIAESVRKIR